MGLPPSLSSPSRWMVATLSNRQLADKGAPQAVFKSFLLSWSVRLWTAGAAAEQSSTWRNTYTQDTDNVETFQSVMTPPANWRRATGMKLEANGCWGRCREGGVHDRTEGYKSTPAIFVQNENNAVLRKWEDQNSPEWSCETRTSVQLSLACSLAIKHFFFSLSLSLLMLFILFILL